MIRIKYADTSLMIHYRYSIYKVLGKYNNKNKLIKS
jgi:hypothetical protein